MRAERRCVLDNRDEIMLLYLILELMAYLAFQMASGSSKSEERQGPASRTTETRSRGGYWCNSIWNWNSV